MDDSHTITSLLEQWQCGQDDAFDQLLPLVYEELRRIAVRYRAAEHVTLQPTAIVHEAYLRFRAQGGAFKSRTHFYAAAALAMRRLLVDHARTRLRQKRGGGAVRLELDKEQAGSDGPETEILALDQALERLGALDEYKLRIVQLQFFGGLTYEETAKLVDRSPASVGRDLRFAKAWLAHELASGDRS